MLMKIYLKCDSPSLATLLKAKILSNVENGKFKSWNANQIATPNNTQKTVIFHTPSSGQYDEEGKDVCFGLFVDGNTVVVIPGLLSNWCAAPDFEQQQLHLGRLTTLLLSYRPYYHSLTIS